jgi:hypothetical protein
MASSVAAARPGDLRRRLLRHYLPITAASAMAFAVFLVAPYFDANRYGHASAIFVKGIGGAWPTGDGGPIDRQSMEHGTDSPGAGTQHGNESPGAGTQHGNESPGAGTQHGNDSPGSGMPHGGAAGPGTQHNGAGQQPSPTQPGVTPSPGDSTQHSPSGRSAAAQQWRPVSQLGELTRLVEDLVELARGDPQRESFAVIDLYALTRERWRRAHAVIPTSPSA